MSAWFHVPGMFRERNINPKLYVTSVIMVISVFLVQILKSQYGQLVLYQSKHTIPQNVYGEVQNIDIVGIQLEGGSELVCLYHVG